VLLAFGLLLYASRMETQFWKKSDSKKNKPLERRVLDCEEFDSSDRWMRDCRVRSEAWFTIESWARENGFHMVAYKSKKRLYQKGMAPDSFIYFLEVRHEERRVVLKAWIEVSRKMQWFSLFHLPAELKVNPLGFWGVRQRRRFCGELNQLLVELKQPELAESHLFHWADLDQTTIGLIGVLCTPLLLFLLSILGKIEVSPGLSNPMMGLVGSKLGWLIGSGLTGVILHHWFVVKQVKKSWASWSSFGFQSLLFVAFTIFLLSGVDHELREQKIVHYCISHFKSTKCQKALTKLSDQEKKDFAKRLEEFNKEIAIKPD